jgi:uncharacterized Zn finger protein
MHWGWRPYVSAAEKRARAQRHVQKLQKQGRTLQPVQAAGRAVAKTFWGKAWCDNLERYSDFSNRLPRGRSYLRNGSVLDLQITKGKITAIVQGSSIYDVVIDLDPLKKNAWKQITKDCSQSIHSLLDLLQGRLSDGVMERLVHPQNGLFPQPKEILLGCSCPDWADVCKHVAAVLYGVGTRLDTQPELLFLLRQVDQAELVQQAVSESNLDAALSTDSEASLQGADLGELFGIEIETPKKAKSSTRRSSKPKGTKKPDSRSASAKGTRSSTRRPERTSASAKKKLAKADCQKELRQKQLRNESR